MKRKIFLVTFLFLFMFLMVVAGEAQNTPRFFVNGKEVSVGKFIPMIITSNGKVFLPIDELEKILGLKIKWDPSNNEFFIQNSTSTIISTSSSSSITPPATMTISSVATQGITLKLAASKAMSLEPLRLKEGDKTIVEFSYNAVIEKGDEFFIYSAQPKMKFVTLVYKITNNWVESKKVPDIKAYIKTDKGFYYDKLNTKWPQTGYNYESATKKEINEFLGKYNGYKSTLLPGQSTKGWVIFEIPKDEKPVEIVLEGVNARILLKGAF